MVTLRHWACRLRGQVDTRRLHFGFRMDCCSDAATFPQPKRKSNDSACHHARFSFTWVWVNIKPLGDRRFLSLVPFTRATQFGVVLFLTHSHISETLPPMPPMPRALPRGPLGVATTIPTPQPSMLTRRTPQGSPKVPLKARQDGRKHILWKQRQYPCLVETRIQQFYNNSDTHRRSAHWQIALNAVGTITSHQQHKECQKANITRSTGQKDSLRTL